MKTIKISDDDLKEIVKKVYSEQLRPSKGNLPQSFGFNLEKKPTDHRKIKVEYMVDRFLNRFMDIGEEYGEDFALEVLEELKNKLEKKFYP